MDKLFTFPRLCGFKFCFHSPASYYYLMFRRRCHWICWLMWKDLFLWLYLSIAAFSTWREPWCTKSYIACIYCILSFYMCLDMCMFTFKNVFNKHDYLSDHIWDLNQKYAFLIISHRCGFLLSCCLWICNEDRMAICLVVWLKCEEYACIYIEFKLISWFHISIFMYIMVWLKNTQMFNELTFVLFMRLLLDCHTKSCC